MPDKFASSKLEVPNAATKAAMEEARQGGLPCFGSVSELMAHLIAEDRAHDSVPTRPV
jgi:hypothetical protein